MASTVVAGSGFSFTAFLFSSFMLLLNIAVWGLGVYLVVLLIRALRKYLDSGKVSEETKEVRKSLGEVIKDNRIRCSMTQEFVAEQLGVSRQAVSKWENGTSDPSTTNLLALAKLFGISAEELLRSMEQV